MTQQGEANITWGHHKGQHHSTAQHMVAVAVGEGGEGGVYTELFEYTQGRTGEDMYNFKL